MRRPVLSNRQVLILALGLLLVIPTFVFAGITPRLELAAYAGSAGSRVAVTGVNFPPKSKGFLYFDDQRDSDFHVDANGRMSMTLRVPERASGGTHTVRAYAMGPQRSRGALIASTTFTVQAEGDRLTPAPSPTAAPTATAQPTSTPAPTAIPSTAPTATPAPTQSPTPTATPKPTVTPTPTATAAPTATPKPTATPAPTIPPSQPETTAGACPTIYGYGAGTTGGSHVVEVSSFAQLRSAAAVSGNKVVITGNSVWDGNGDEIHPAANVTITRASGSSTVLWNTWITVRNSNVILDNLVVRTGDDEVVAGDADPISINAPKGTTISNVVVNNVEAVFGPDVGGITVLTNGGQLSNVTIQCSIIGHGLHRSAHPEGTEDADGHSYAINISGINPASAPTRISLYRNLIIGSQNRNPRVCGSSSVDVVNNVIYNYGAPPQCNPVSLNLVNNVLREGPAPEAAGLNEESGVFRHKTSGDFPSPFANAVYESGNVIDAADGTSGGRQGPASVFRSSPAGTISVPVASTSGLLDSVLSTVGPTTRDALTRQHLNEVVTRTGSWYSGAGFAAPNARPQ